jgi:type IV secretory pathway VirB2 component (pilin)
MHTCSRTFDVKNVIRTFLSSPYFLFTLLAVILFFCAIHSAHASDAAAGAGTGLPWEGPLSKIRQSISGPVAFVISLLGLIACGATLIWGGEVSEFLRRIIYLVLVISLIVFANTILTGVLFSGAMVPSNTTINESDLTPLTQSMTSQR